jgi:hypothetical protein
MQRAYNSDKATNLRKKDIQHNVQKKKNKRTNNDPQKHHTENDRATQIPLIPGDK